MGIIVISGIENTSLSQSSCKVLLDKISESYDGDCKKGFAHGAGLAKGLDSYEGEFKKGHPHGKGTYSQYNGNVYEGGWSGGKKNGVGVLTIKTTKEDSVVNGYWRNDRYLGKTNVPVYSVTFKENFERFTLRNNDELGNRLQITIQSTGRVSNLNIDSSSKRKQGSIGTIYINDLEFPFKASIRYSTPSKCGGTMLNVMFDFVINDPGLWELTFVN